MKIKLLFASAFVMMILNSQAQKDERLWNHKKSAVVLTYDDALSVHLDYVMPALDSLGLKATFYVSGYSGVLNNRIAEWKKLAAKGHELGNHTYFHPCTGSLPGRSFVTAEYDLDKYSITRIVNEIRLTNLLLRSIDGKTKRSFAYPCGDTKIGDSSYFDQLRNEFTGARGVKSRMLTMETVDLYDIDCYSGNGQTGEELISLVKQAEASHTLIVFLFHGVGGGHSLNISLEAHSKLIHYLKQKEKEIWIAPMTEVAEYIRNSKSSLKKKS